jgi:hypothetical protein
MAGCEGIAETDLRHRAEKASVRSSTNAAATNKGATTPHQQVASKCSPACQTPGGVSTTYLIVFVLTVVLVVGCTA